jgi:hypothetical protein
LSQAALPQIWKPPSFPSNMHPFILSLLERFEISFPINANVHKLGTHTAHTTRTTHDLTTTPVGNYASVLRPTSAGEELYLIPSMLPEVKPAQLQDLWPAKKGTFQFSFIFYY